MNTKAESTKLVIIMSVALITLGILFVTFGKSPTLTGKATYTQEACYTLFNGKLTPQEVTQCCAAIKKSTSCTPHVIENINDELFLCEGQPDVVVNKNTIDFCEG